MKKAALLALALLAVLGRGAPAQQEDPLEKARYEARVEVVDGLLQDWTPQDYRQRADLLKGEGRYDLAAVYYLVALKMKPDFVKARYQLACDFALWGQKKLALSHLTKAIEAGYWGWEEMKDDDDLASIQGDPAFADLLQTVKNRYAVEAPKHAGGSLLCLPEGLAPSGGWPTIVILHGWGTSKEDMKELGELCAKCKVAAVCLSGTVVLGEGSYRWSTEKVEETHEAIQKALAGYGDKKLDAKRVLVGGFSQGAIHAASLVMKLPDSYSGALALSPGGGPPLPPKIEKPERSRKLFLTIGDKEHPGNKANVEKAEALFKAAKLPVRVEHHGEGHQFPPNGKELFPKALEWLRAP